MTVCKCKDDLLVPFSETTIPSRSYFGIERLASAERVLTCMGSCI